MHKLSWEAHQNYVSNKVNQLIAFLNRNLPTDTSVGMNTVSYKQLVSYYQFWTSYCVTIWDLYYRNAENQTEILQNCAAHFVLKCSWKRH